MTQPLHHTYPTHRRSPVVESAPLSRKLASFSVAAIRSDKRTPLVVAQSYGITLRDVESIKAAEDG
jgi:hypothetical protein